MNASNKKEPFELGLVMAGAISAGAYTAGVIDFLLQTLEEWQQLKDKGEGPPHDVKIRVMSGASAGGMTSAITAAMLNGSFSPVDNLAGDGPHASNPLYDSWVKKIDIKPLLGSDDLRDNKPVVSLLDSTILGKIAHDALQFTPNGATPPYIGDELHLYLTVTNMRGVPYRVAFQGLGTFGHEISMNADHLHFVAGQPNPANQGVVTLDPNNPDSPCWQKLQQAALATGAFPMGLAPRILSRPATDYDSLQWDIPHPDPTNTDSVLYTRQSIKPTWPTEFTPPFDYDFICVDGGLMNNEPLELARRNLARGGFSNPRDPDKVNRAVLMIDPFPSEGPVTKKDVCGYAAYDIIKVFTSMFSSLKQQARFKPEELVLAQDEKVYSRWMIAPIRYDAQGKRADYPIASGMLGGFGGFLSEVFRRHDFQLGRRNCQKFLRETFVIPLEEAKKNPVFKSYSPTQFNDYKVTVNGIDCLQIIPVDWLQASKTDVPPLAWDKIPKGDWEDIQGLIKDRMDKVADRLVDTKLEGNFIGQVVARLGLFFLKGKMKDSIIAAVEKELKKYELM